MASAWRVVSLKEGLRGRALSRIQRQRPWWGGAREAKPPKAERGLAPRRSSK